VPEPSYPLFGLLTSLEGVQAVPYALRSTASGTSTRRRCNSRRAPAQSWPSAPGTRPGLLKQAERAALAGRCASAGCALICDEVFADFALVADPLRVPTVAAHDDVLAFALSGLSKICGLPQLKLGWCAVSGRRTKLSARCRGWS